MKDIKFATRAVYSTNVADSWTPLSTREEAVGWAEQILDATPDTRVEIFQLETVMTANIEVTITQVQASGDAGGVEPS